MELAGQEVAACGDHGSQLQQAGGGQQRLHGVLAHLDEAGVAVLHEQMQCIPMDLAEGHLLLFGLAQRSREHGREVGARGR